MSGPGKDNIPSDQNPHPVPDNKVLHPLFGTFCMSETFSAKTGKPGVQQHQHFEAHLDDPVKKTWTVSKVVTTIQGGFNPYRQKSTVSTHLVKSKVSFKEAVEQLVALEKDCKDKPALFSTLYPDAPVMGFLHFKAFAEREGYVFDTNGKPHARPNARVLPLGFTYNVEDVDSANSRVLRPEDEFDNNGPASKLPNTHFLLDNFTKAANKDDFQTSLNGQRAMNILDGFVDHIEKANTQLEKYCKDYRLGGQGGLIDDADRSLQLAESSLRQLRAYGVDTTEYDHFVLQCRVAAFVLHAEGLYDLMNRGVGDYNANEALFQLRVRQAIDTFKKFDPSESAHRTLENMIVQTSEPQVPDAIGGFVQKYRVQRGKFSGTGATPAAPATPPKGPKP